MLHEVYGDLVKDKEYTFFCHQTNCQATMGAGIAKQIANVYPEVKETDKTWYDYCKKHNKQMLGRAVFTLTSDERTCVNLYAQDRYGAGMQTDYEAFRSCLQWLEFYLVNISPDVKVGFPYGIGCGLGGGSWEKVKPLLEEFANKVPQEVYIVRLKEGEK